MESLVTLSHRLGAAVIGEGVESFADLEVLSELDVDHAQGFAIAVPAAQLQPIGSDVVAACRSGRRRVLRGGTATGLAAAIRTRDVYAVTAALSSAGRRDDIVRAISAAAADLDVDMIGVSILSNELTLSEIATNSGSVDTTVYSVADFPVTLATLTGGGIAEIQLGNLNDDKAERDVMRKLGKASMLMVPVLDAARPIGVVEFAHRTPKRWNAHDVAHAKGLAENLGPVLRRMGVGLASFEPDGPTQ